MVLVLLVVPMVVFMEGGLFEGEDEVDGGDDDDE